jgi:phosphate-selective porin OprO/OprP
MPFKNRSCLWIVAFCLLESAAPGQAPPRTADKRHPKRPAMAKREEVEELRREVSAQRQEIDGLRSMIQKLVEGNEQAAAAAREAQASATQAQQVAGQAQGQAAQAQTVAATAQEASDQTEFKLAEVRTGAQLDKEAIEKKISAVAIQSGWNGEHFFLKDSEGRFNIEPFGYTQLDYRAYGGDTTPPNTFAIRRGRFGFQGNLGKHYQFTFLADFADRNSTLAREFSINANYLPALQFKFGQFKEPFSQEELVTASYIDFVERSPLNNLAPAYSPGTQVHGQVLGGVIQYQLGAFNGKSFLNLNDNSTPEGVLRVRFYPWKNTSNKWLSGLAFGGAGADGRTHNGSSFSGLMPDRTFTFFKTEPVNGKVLRADGELTWIVGPAALRAEYDQTNQQRATLGKGGTNLPAVVAKGYYVTTTYLLTGERRPENGQPNPNHPFLSEAGSGFGAWELKFRYSNLQMGDGSLRNRVDQFSAGLNWYPSYFVRYMIDVNVERLKNPIASPVALSPQTFVTILQRVQVRF